MSNFYENGSIVGYKVKIGLPFYRSVPLSCVEEISLLLDNEEVDPSLLHLDSGSAVYKLSELSGREDVWWGFVDKWDLCVRDGIGLSEGSHKVKIHFLIRTPYLIPADGDFIATYDETNAVKFLEVKA